MTNYKPLEKNIMAFVNEYVSPQDVKKYDLDGIKQRFGKDPDIRYQWTVDRERNVFLMWMEAGREERSHDETFSMHFKGTNFLVHLVGFSAGKIAEKVTTTWQLEKLGIPPELESRRSEIIDALKEALTEYKASGIGVPVADHTAFFEF